MLKYAVAVTTNIYKQTQINLRSKIVLLLKFIKIYNKRKKISLTTSMQR